MNRAVSALMIIGCLLLNLIPAQTSAEENLVEIIKKAKPAVVKVIIPHKHDNGYKFGSGFFIDNRGTFITNFHVLGGATAAKVKTLSGKSYPVSRVLAEDLAADLIMATIVPEAPTPYLKVSGVIPQPGEKVITLGSPSGEEWTAADGIVSAVREKKWHGRIKKFVQISAPISHGSSGGPAINLKGEVIGVNTFTREKSQNLNFSSIGQNVLDLKPGSGVTLEQRAAAWVTEGKEEVQQGVQAMHAKKNQDALVHLKNARLLAPELPEVYYNIGLYYLAVGNQKEAAVAAKKLKDLNPQLHQELVAQFKAGGKSPKAP